MDPAQIERLKEEHLKGLQLCRDKIVKWKNFKDDYKALKERLLTLPDKLSYPVTVPFGNNAFIKGKIVHTNELMVLLGDNFFADVTAKQATDIVSRRINQCEDMLEKLNVEKDQFENWLNYIGEVSSNENLVEIIESFDADKEKSWREQHAMNVKSYRQQLAKERLSSEDTYGIIDSDEDYLDKLDKLALQEDEFDSNEKESDRSTVECSDDGSHSEEHPIKSALKLQLNCNRFRRTSESETGDDVEDINKRDGDLTESSSPRNNKHVRWQDLSKQNIKKITFKHSKVKNQPYIHTAKHRMHDSGEHENHPLIQSPSDIYKQFGNFFQSSPPKSILKVKSPSPTTAELNGPIFPTSKDPVSKESSPETDENTNSPFTGEVRECSSPINIVEKSSRPTSQFKSSRKNRKR